MSIIYTNFNQNGFSEDDIIEMLGHVRRRQLTEEWDFISLPRSEGQDYALHLPFDPFKVAFKEVFNAIDHIPWGENKNNTFYTYLKDVEKRDIEKIEKYYSSIIGCIAIKDCLPISFAIDFDRENGDPEQEQTRIGKIRRKAKPYGSEVVNNEHYRAADELAEKTIEFIRRVIFYNNLDAIIGMPPSNPDKEYTLTHYLAKKITGKIDFEDLSSLVNKDYRTPGAKSLPVDQKLDAIKGSITVSKKVLHRKILLLDDLYQSGITMNYVAMLLLEKGAQKVYGLACEKTCTNDDNTGN